MEVAMRRRTLGAAAAAVVLSLAMSPARTAAQNRSVWVHVRVEEARRQAKVSVNLPISVVEAALQAAPEKVIADGRIHLGHHGDDLSVADLRRAWSELK